MTEHAAGVVQTTQPNLASCFSSHTQYTVRRTYVRKHTQTLSDMCARGQTAQQGSRPENGSQVFSTISWLHTSIYWINICRVCVSKKQMIFTLSNRFSHRLSLFYKCSPYWFFFRFLTGLLISWNIPTNTTPLTFTLGKVSFLGGGLWFL